MTPDQLEALGSIADRIDAILGMEDIPVPVEIAREGRKGSLRSIRDDLRGLFIEICGEDPWETLA